jgi:hypothetical protein
MGFICSSLCFNQERAYFACKYPSRKTSSEHTLTLTNDKYIYNPKKVNEGVKYDSYIRVLRRRRNQNMPCSKQQCTLDNLNSCKIKGQLCSIDKTVSAPNQTAFNPRQFVP